MKYSEYFMKVLADEGYTHCFFVAGGNVMHLLDSASLIFECVAFTHEHSAVIASEYFNKIHVATPQRAFSLVTAGPGLTNAVTAIAGSWLESRENLIIGGQVKTADLKSPNLRQLGIQEIDGREIVRTISKVSETIYEPVKSDKIKEYLATGRAGRKGPVFLEICLDVQARNTFFDSVSPMKNPNELSRPADVDETKLGDMIGLLMQAERPVFLLGGGLEQHQVRPLVPALEKLGVPIMTSWNGADLVSSESPIYFGRPNTWGQRAANIVLQQADLLVAFGARLGLQQTGFAWDDFLPLGKIVQIDIDASELEKTRPTINLAINGDAFEYLQKLLELIPHESCDWGAWREFAEETTAAIGVLKENREPNPPYVDPYAFVKDLSKHFGDREVIIPSSSGGSFTVTMQAIDLIGFQRLISNKGLASMGYGLAGAIGASFAAKSRVVLLEGDGGFLQNAQELSTVAEHRMNLKIFLFSNNGYASIRMTQRNYFNGNIVGTGKGSGLRMPSWENLAKSFGIGWSQLGIGWQADPRFLENFAHDLPWIFEVLIDEEQTYFPKIGSRVETDGSMRSNPLHKMDPMLDPVLSSIAFPYLEEKS